MAKNSLMKVALCCAMLLTIIQVAQSKPFEICKHDCLEARGCTNPPGLWCELNCEIFCGPITGGESYQLAKNEDALNAAAAQSQLTNAMKPSYN